MRTPAARGSGVHQTHQLHGNMCGQGVKTANAHLHAALRLVTSVAGMTTRNAPEGCTPVVWFNR